MPRLIKYTQPNGLEIPDTALAVIEHSTLFYLIDRQFPNKFQKYMAFMIAGTGYELFIDNLKKKRSGDIKNQ